ncbi:MAG: AAA family ATPase [Firmicutes bacterium]|nr:AAA family ATPase [Bacillota bacterium]
MAGLPDPVGSMIEALDLEIAHIRRRGHSSRLELRGGVLHSRVERLTIYRFPLAEDLGLRDDTPVKVICGEQELEGSVVAVKEDSILVALEADLGEKIAYALLIADNAFPLERLRARLDEVRDGAVRFNRTLADQVIGEQTITPNRVTVHPSVLKKANEELNDEQQQAIKRACQQSVTFVWGPPGTGKTTVVARIVEVLYHAGYSVLLVSNTNMAVDTALEKIAERLQTDKGFKDGRILRYGPITKESLDRKFGENIGLDRIVERETQALRIRKGKLEAELSMRERRAEVLQQQLLQWETLEQLQRRLAQAHELLREQSQQYELSVSRLAELEQQIEHLEKDIKRAKGMGFVLRLLHGLDPHKLMRERARAIAARSDAELALNEAKSLMNERMTAVERLRQQVAEQRTAVASLPPYHRCRQALMELEAEIQSLKSKLKTIDDEIAGVRQRLLNESRVVATTAYRTYLQNELSRPFDAVVIDEASMVMLPMSFYVAGLASRTVTVSGDFRQLPAIVSSQEQLVREWLQKDVFEKAGIVRQVEVGKLPSHVVGLRKQYRMHEEICRVVNELFYVGRLETAEGTPESEPPRIPWSNKPLAYVDTSNLGGWTARPLQSLSCYNLAHALLVRNLARQLGLGPDELGVVSPYSAQARLLNVLLTEDYGVQGLCSTVHRYQGNERSVMIVEISDSIGAPLSNFMKATAAQDVGARLFNVAISRAKHHVLLVANFGFLRSAAPPSATVLSILDAFEQQGERIEAPEILELASAYWRQGWEQLMGGFPSESAEAGSIYTEGTFYPSFRHDLRRARQSVVVVSPYLTSAGVGRWVEYFRACLMSGVSVRIVTRPPGRQGGVLEHGLADTLEQLRQLGIVVDLRADMHEKMAIIDGEILWHGSLNILSHRDTSESMLRVHSRALCEQMARFFSFKKHGDTDVTDWAAPENPLCPDCGQITVLKSGRRGPYFECAKSCGGKVSSTTSSQRRKSPRKSRSSGASKPCPRQDCDGRLVRRMGRYGPFLGCSRFPKCDYTESI